MAQGYTKFPITGTFSGVELVTQLNNATDTVLTLQGGSTDPATANNAIAGSFWQDSGNNILKVRNASNTAWQPLIKTNNGFLLNVTSDVQTQLNNKQATITGAASSVTNSNLTASRALVSNTSGKIAASSTITTTELGYLNGVTSNIQTQLNSKAPTANPTFTGSVVIPNATADTNPVTLGQFPSSLGTSGWKKFPDQNSPSGYFIMQWMLATESTSSSNWKTLPMTFPNVILGGHVTPAQDTGAGGGAIVSKTTSQIVFKCGDAYNNGTVGFVTVWGY